MKVLLSNKDLVYTIDTYSTFTVDSAYESEAEYYSEEYGIDRDSVDFDFNHRGYVQALSECSVEYLRDNFKDSEIIKSITLVTSKSPQFYNYTTDSYDMVIDYRLSALKKYINDNYDDYVQFVKTDWHNALYNANFDTKLVDRGKWSSAIDDYVRDDVSIFKDDDCIASMLDYYTRQEYTEEQYLDDMYESVNEIAYEFMKPDEDTRKLIEKSAV
jgi:hypothetical protein